MDLREILTENFVFLYELFGLFILLSISVHVSERIKELTKAIIGLMAIEAAMFYLEKWTQTLSYPSLLRAMLTAAIYSIYPVILVFLMQIMTPGNYSRKRLLILLIPEFICVPLFFTSQWTHLVAYYLEPNNYAGGPLANLPYFLFVFYLIVFAVRNYLYFRKSPIADRLSMFFIFCIPVIGVVWYALGETGKDYTAIFTSATVLYFMYVYIYMSKIDGLTSLQNRQSYYKAIHAPNKVFSGVVSVDMNNLKDINDNHGHEAGDKALQTVAAVMRDNCGRGGTVYRVGGDEFMILYSGASEAEISAAIAAMREKMAETDYMCAFGWSMTRPDADIEDTIREADQKMYEDKARLKAGRPRANAAFAAEEHVKL